MSSSYHRVSFLMIIFFFVAAITRLLYVVLIVASVPLAPSDLYDIQPDYSEFSFSLESVAAHTAIGTNTCWQPPQSAMFTYLNKHSLPLLDTWLASLQINQIIDCIVPRTVVVCFDEQSLQGCKNSRLLHCAYVPVGELSPGDYGQKPYYFFTYVKHEMIAVALKVVHRILYFDIDTLLIHNPWPAIFDASNLTKYDLRYQREMGKQESCSGSINTGILFASNSSATWGYLNAMREYKYRIIVKQRGSDQKFLNRFVSAMPNLRRCALPATLFISPCLFFNGDITFLPMHEIRAEEIIMYHASCVSSVASKLVLLTTVHHIFNFERNTSLARIVSVNESLNRSERDSTATIQPRVNNNRDR